MHDSMKASKELWSRLCLLGDVSLSAARWGVSGVASPVSDTAQVSGGSRGGAPPGVLASARRARFARGAVPARTVADGGWGLSSHSVSGIGPSGSVSGWSAINASPPPCAAMSSGWALCTAGRSAPPPGSPIGVGVAVRCGGPLHFFRAHHGLPALRLGWHCRRLGFIVRRLLCPSGVAFRHGRRLGSASRARGLQDARWGDDACRVRAGVRARGWPAGR